ncbi:ABC transporter permease [Pelagibacterium halotolerans]|uniref:Dipeptide transport system permease protein DppB n=1 Tax=Pelagibacterium halotolerans (strain DSM 22347 / JCM 15775 / CGMCC 1.7692 / B2) TaxID=1082931 RepID=G4R7D1_PELHB|nr:ABC transporter permease [Pelagibacterium halotolerans]AEQ51267.1 dipeptide transport system permease protein DppB [Pelagibacterium halotolerans B2]QJR18876.1 ABC transporter permease [Pelagibacterium halotolerans]SEA66873.1 peptide/nickel transport system permease protein [Pelagibacterium halotolerans]
MLSYLIRRIGSGVVLLAIVATITFVMLFGATENVAQNILGENATDEQIVALEQRLGLDRPLLAQYGTWLSGAVTGDLGTSWLQSERVSTILSHRVPVTLSMVSIAIVVIAVVSAVLGIVAAVRGGWADKTIQVLSIVGFSMPNFWLGLILVVFFALTLRWFPATGYVSFFSSPVGWISSLTLPVAAIVLSGIASASQQIRGAVIDVLKQDYVRTLRARGISPKSVLIRHALRNALPAALTVLSVQFIALLGGAAIIERVFAIPGLGSLTVQASLSGDIPVVMGVVVTAIVIVVVVNVVIDIIHAWVNPKVRLS